jgi:hypothetical protein
MQKARSKLKFKYVKSKYLCALCFVDIAMDVKGIWLINSIGKMCINNVLSLTR